MKKERGESQEKTMGNISMEFAAVLHNIRSLHNVGSIFRTADGAGVGKVFLCGITPAPLDRFGCIRPQFAKVSLGAEKNVKWEKVSSTIRLLKRLRADGWKIFAVEQNKNSIPYFKLKTEKLKTKSGAEKFALVLGGEIRGLSPSVLRHCDKILEIPMRSAMVRQARHPRRSGQGKESLNVAVAFAIVIFHLIYSDVPIR